MKVAVIIPALNEVATIGSVVSALRGPASHVIVVDGGSVDGTQAAARRAGATLVREPVRGYGRACTAGVRCAQDLGAAVIAFCDAALAEDPADIHSVIEPILRGDADLVIGSRTRGHCEPGALRPWQRAGNRLATTLIRVRHGHSYSDLGSLRAVRSRALERMRLREETWGWPTEMQVRALELGLRVHEVPVSYRRRQHGRSKVSGSLRGAVRAGATILRVILWRPR